MSAIDFEGMTVPEAAAVLGKTTGQARAWLNHHGYRIPGDFIRRPRTAAEVQDEIAARLAAAPPSGSCFRCGAARGCQHRHH